MDASPEVAKRFLTAIVNVHTEVPARHPSARLLGKERAGSGTVVSSDGLILTVNHVIMGGGDDPRLILQGPTAQG